jgi:regulator of protease activity HflC (stomatin/prohibitin superfamily)
LKSAWRVPDVPYRHAGEAAMSAVRSQDRIKNTISGYAMVSIGLLLLVGGIVTIIRNPTSPTWVLAGVASLFVAIIVLAGLYMLQPNQSAVLTLFGRYMGTDRSNGLRWANPFYRKTKVSLRAHNFVSDRIKVNDARGNPIEIAAAIVWRVRDAAQALFDVEDYEAYVRVQAETAIRHLASSYPYDEGITDIEAGDIEPRSPKRTAELTLRSSMAQVTQSLMNELSDRLDVAGINIDDAKLTHLAYASEIAGVMLRRQQAEAIIAARQKIVLGAVTMVEMALKGLSDRHIIELDDERKAAMVSNLLVVLCSENDTQPIINTGTLYN